MNLFNLFKSDKTPKRAPAAAKAHRSFAAAEVSRILQPWHWDNGYSNIEIASSLAIMRSRSRDMQKNSEHYARWLDLFVANVVGDTGFTLIPQPALSKTDPTVDAKAAHFLKYHFWRWASTPKWADVTGRKSFASICRLVAENWARDGEGVVLIDRAAQNPYGISLRVIRPDALDETANGSVREGRIIVNGVEVNSVTRRPVAYVFRADREDPGAFFVGKSFVSRVPANEVLHVFTQHDECQTRGVPLGCSVLKKLKMLDEYNISELVAARDEANTTGIYTAPLGRESELTQYTDAESAALTLPSDPGTKIMLEPGWDYKTVTPHHPNRELTAFKNSMLRDIASGLGLEYANFANDWGGVSYSSVRAGTLAERDHWRTLQAQMIEQFASPVFDAWLASFLKLQASGAYKEDDYPRLEEHEFRGRRWDWVDPMKDVNASVIAVAHNWKTNEQIAADYGCDLDDNMESNARSRLIAGALGVMPPGPMNAAVPDSSTNDD